jgi:hypothetical protein
VRPDPTHRNDSVSIGAPRLRFLGLELPAPIDSPEHKSSDSSLARTVRIDSRVYFTGGATAVLQGWRKTTIDVDQVDPRPRRDPARDTAAEGGAQPLTA